MRAFWRRDRDRPLSEGTRARMKAQRELEATKAETPKYRALAESLIEIQRVNHLGHSAAKLIRGDS